ncbi:MAG: thymidine phosphorylase, partial [Pseudomonadota bacterium]
KSGSGAFMAAEDQAVRLAESLVGVADGAGTNASAVLTDMNQPLASAAGNAVEVLNAVQFLTGEKWEPRLLEVTLTLATEMIIVSGVETENKKARAKAESALESGSAAEVFAKMVSALGGPADFVDRATDYLPRAPVIVEVLSEAPGYISSIDTREVGLAVVSLGGGRERAEDAVDHSVGLTDVVELGTSIEAGDALAVVHAATAEDAEKAASEIRAAITLGDTTPIREDVIKARIGR